MRTRIKQINEIDDEFIFDDEAIPREQKMKINEAIIEPQFMYLGRLVNKRFFRAFVYGAQGIKLADDYDQFHELVSSGLWFESQIAYEASKNKKDKPEKNESNKTDSCEKKLFGKNKKKSSDPTNNECVDEVIEYGSDR